MEAETAGAFVQVRQRNRAHTAAADDEPAHAKPIDIQILPFESNGVPGRRPYTQRFEDALRSYLAAKGIRASGGAAPWIVKGQVLHVEGADTPFLVELMLYTARSGRPGTLVGCWSGYAGTVYHFGAALQDPGVHPRGLSGELGDRLCVELSNLSFLRRLGEQLNRLRGDTIKARALLPRSFGAPRFSPVQSGIALPVRADSPLRIELAEPDLKSAAVVAKDEAGNWYLLSVLRSGISTSRARASDITLDLLKPFGLSNSVQVWIIVSDSEAPMGGGDNAPTSRIASQSAVQASSGGWPPEETLVEKQDADRQMRGPVRVWTGLSAASDLNAWFADPLIKAVATGAAADREPIRVLAFTLRALR